MKKLLITIGVLALLLATSFGGGHVTKNAEIVGPGTGAIYTVQ